METITVCPKCDGLLIAETEVDEQGEREWVKCVICGWRPGRVGPMTTGGKARVKRYRERCRCRRLCPRCGRPAGRGILCPQHQLKERLRGRRRLRAAGRSAAWVPGGVGRPPINEGCGHG